MYNKTLYYFGGLLATLVALTLSEVCNTSEIIDTEEGAKQVEELMPEKHICEEVLEPNTLVYKHKTNN